MARAGSMLAASWAMCSGLISHAVGTSIWSGSPSQPRPLGEAPPERLDVEVHVRRGPPLVAVGA